MRDHLKVVTNQNGYDSLVLLLHQVTDDLVVEILHRLPLQKATCDIIDRHMGENNHTHLFDMIYMQLP